MTAQEKANALLAKAEDVAEDDSIPPHRRQYEHSQLMLQWCTASAVANPRDSAGWARLAEIWSKRVSVALDALDKDKLDEILAAIAELRRDGDALEALE